MRNASALVAGMVLAAVALYALVAGHKSGAAVVGGVGALTIAMPLLRKRLRPDLSFRQQLWISITFFLVVAVGFALLAAATDSSVKALAWLVAIMFLGLAIASIYMDDRLRNRKGP